MDVLKQPAALSYSGNLEHLVLSSNEPVLASLFKGETLLFEQNYVPDANGIIDIDFSEKIASVLSFTLEQRTTPWEQTNIVSDFLIQVGATEIAFRVVRGGIKNTINAADFFIANFLTWQPQTKDVTYYLPEFLTYYATVDVVVRLRAFYSDDQHEDIQLAVIPAGKAMSVPASYVIVNGLLTKKLPGFYDVWVEDQLGQRLSYVQRYVAAPSKGEDEAWFFFENSLGGVDTFRAGGQREITGEYEHLMTDYDDTLEEYRTELTQKIKQNTGLIDEYERRWLLDFFSSVSRYVYDESAFRKIVIHESDVAFSKTNSINSYSFVFSLTEKSQFLPQSIRSESLQDPITIEIPDVGSFTLPPRLAEFPQTDLDGGALMLLQNPFSGQWSASSIEALIQYIQGSDSFASWLSILGSLSQKYLSKKDADTAAGLITFLQGIVSTSVQVGDYQEGMTTGSGAMIDEGGNAEMQSLILRSFLKVPSLIYNKIEVTGGEMWNTTGGVIQSVVPDGLHSFVLTLDIEDGDHVEFHIDDICKGIYNVGTGFVTSYFRVVYVDDAAKTIRIVLGSDNAVPGGMNSNPVKFMNIAKYGNFTNKERQRSQYFSSSEQKIIMLSGVDDYIIRPENIVLQIGSLTGVDLPDNLPINTEDASIYLKNVIAENFFQIDSKGEVIKQIIDRGLWVVDAVPEYVSNSQFQDEVYHKSCKYRCIVDGTNQEPRYDSTDWLLVAGDTSLGMFVSSSAGQSFKYNELYTTLTATVYRGVTDITGDIMAEDWSWTRETSDVVGDAAWNSSHANATNTVSLTPFDLNNTTGKFTCTAYVRDGFNTEILTQEILF